MSDDLKLVKELRDKTWAGFLDCKEALAKNEGNLDNAIDYLRKKGLAKASKKSSRRASRNLPSPSPSNRICFASRKICICEQRACCRRFAKTAFSKRW